MALVYGLPIFEISLDSYQVHEPFEYGHQKAETVSLHLSIVDSLQEFSFSLPLIFNFRFEYNPLHHRREVTSVLVNADVMFYQ